MDKFFTGPLIDLPHLADIAISCVALLVLLIGINLVALNRRQQPLKIDLHGWFFNLLLAVPVGYMLYVVGTMSQPVFEKMSPEPLINDTEVIAHLTEEIPARPTLPDWASTTPVKHDDTVTVTVQTGRFVSKEDAKTDLVEKATPVIIEEFHLHYPGGGTWELPDDLIHEIAVTRRHWEITEEDFGTSIGKRTMYKLYAQLELTPVVRKEVHKYWRNAVIVSRLEIVGGIVAVIIVLLGGIAGYLRFDDLTNGDYRFRLKLVAVCFMVAALFGIACWVKTLA